MIYLKKLTLPTLEAEDQIGRIQRSRYGEQFFESIYPFGIFPFMDLHQVEFEPLTIFHGANGSGKSTLLNIISAKLHASRSSVYNTGKYTEEFLRNCSFTTDMRWTGEEFDYTGKRDEAADIAKVTKVITSDDIFKKMLEGRVHNEHIRMKALMLSEKVFRIKQKRPNAYVEEIELPRHLDFETGDNVETFKDLLEARKMSGKKYIESKLGKEERGFSNGETGFMHIMEMMEQPGLYILDEPENSLSADLQQQLAEFISFMVRYNHSQVIMSTHSPFLLSLEDAKIYDLAEPKAEVKRFTDLTSMQLYANLFHEKFSAI